MNTITVPNLASPEFKANPYPFYARLRAEAPIFRTTLPSREPAWLVTRYDDAVALLKDDRLAKDRRNAIAPGSKAPWVPAMLRPLAQNMLDLDAPDHTRLRGLVHKAFTARLIERLRERIQELCDDLLTAAQRRGQLDLIHDYAVPVPATIIAELLGVPVADRERFHAWSTRMVSTATPADMVRLLPTLWQFLRYLRRLIALRRADPRDDLTSALIAAEEAGDTLSEDELLAMIVILLIAGHETTINLIGSGTLALLEHPGQLERLRNDAALIKPAVEELARFTSPVELATERYARVDIPIHDVAIPRSEKVLVVLGSANRDERQFANPDVLDITREPNKHLAFGQGAHYCLGSPLARMEGQIAIGTLIERLPALRLVRQPAELRWNKGLFVRGLTQLPLAF